MWLVTTEESCALERQSHFSQFPDAKEPKVDFIRGQRGKYVLFCSFSMYSIKDETQVQTGQLFWLSTLLTFLVSTISYDVEEQSWSSSSDILEDVSAPEKQ